MSYQKKNDNKKKQHNKDQGRHPQTNPPASLNKPQNVQAPLIPQSLSPTKIEQLDSLEKVARLGKDELLQSMVDAKTFPVRQLNLALFAAVEGCSSTKSVENHVNCINHLL